jgi:nucleoid-associated protein YgaU
MYFADTPAPQIQTPASGLGKILVPAGAGLAIGGPLGAAIGAGIGMVLARLGATAPPVPPPGVDELRTEKIDISHPATLDPGLKAQIAAEQAAGAHGPTEVQTLLADAMKIKGYVAAAAPVVGAAGSTIAAALPVALPLALLGAGIYTMAGGDIGAALGIDKPMWDQLTPTQKAMYTAYTDNPSPGGIDALIEAGVMGAGTGSKQIMDTSGNYTTVGRVGTGQYRLPDGTVVGTVSAFQRRAASGAYRIDADSDVNPITGAPLDYQPAVMSMNGYFGEVAYRVQPGDTLTGIALAHGLCKKGPGNTNADWSDCVAAADRIALANLLADQNQIVPGQIITIPDVLSEVVDTPAGPVAVPIAGAKPFPWLWLALGGTAAYLLWKR